MALVACPDCGTEVSDAAVACVKCGRPIAVQPVATEVATRRCPTCKASIAASANPCPKCGHTFTRQSTILIGVLIALAVVAFFWKYDMKEIWDWMGEMEKK